MYEMIIGPITFSFERVTCTNIHVRVLPLCSITYNYNYIIIILTIPSLANSNIFATGKFGFRLLGFRVSAKTDPRLPLGTVSMAAEAATAASFFFLFSCSFLMRSASDCSLPNVADESPVLRNKSRNFSEDLILALLARLFSSLNCVSLMIHPV